MMSDNKINIYLITYTRNQLGGSTVTYEYKFVYIEMSTVKIYNPLPTWLNNPYWQLQLSNTSNTLPLALLKYRD